MQTLQDSTQPSNIPEHFLNTLFEHFPTLYNTIHNFNKTPDFFLQNLTEHYTTAQNIQTSQDFYNTFANLYNKKLHTLYKFFPTQTLQHFTTLYKKQIQNFRKL